MKKLLALVLILGIGPAGNASAQQDAEPIRTEKEGGYVPDEPLWEVRLGGTSLYGPDYPGSPDYSLNGFAAPLVIYRGDRIRFGEYGVARAITAETKTFELDLSADAVYEAGSNEDGARAGMPDLDYLLQIGPQAIINFHDTGWTPDGRSEVKMLLPVRAVASTDFTGFEHVGYIAEPQLTYRRQYGGERRSSWSVTMFSTFADEGLNGFWYDVAPRFATPDRAAYEAEAGYLSTGLRASWTRELSEDFQLYLTYQGRAFQGSANQDSPLLSEDFTHAVSVSFVWKLFKSQKRARNDDM